MGKDRNIRKNIINQGKMDFFFSFYTLQDISIFRTTNFIDDILKMQGKNKNSNITKQTELTRFMKSKIRRKMSNMIDVFNIKKE